MPTIALLLCSAFVFYMLWLDHKQSPEVSFVSWVPALWLLMLASKPLGIWLQSGAETIEEGSPTDRLFMTSLLIVAIITLIKRKFNWSSAIKANKSAIGLVGFMLVSCLFSHDFFISFKRWSQQLITVVMAFVVASENYPRSTLKSLFRRIVYVLMPFSIVCINYFPQYGRAYVHHSGDLMWIGVSMHKNSLAQLCILAIFFLAWTFLRRFRKTDVPAMKYQTHFEILILVVTLWVVGGPYHSFTYSATATVAVFLALATAAGLFLAQKSGIVFVRKLPSILAISLIVYGTVTPMIGGLSLFDVSSAVGRDATLTGRADLWRQLVPVALSQPIFGHGFGGFWTTETRDYYMFSEGHNGYLDTILELGFVGLLFYTAFVMSSIRKAQEMLMEDFDWAVLWIGCLLMGLVVNITESSFASFTSKIMAIVLFFTVTSTTQIRQRSLIR